MNTIRMKKGFTLIELLIVVIILGILAAVAIPRVLSNINISKAAEAYNTLGAISRQALTCAQLAGLTAFPAAGGTCTTYVEYPNGDPNSSANFTYAAPTVAGGVLSIVASLKGGASADTITSNVNATNNTISIVTGTGGIFEKSQ